jgi:hypothetical protein
VTLRAGYVIGSEPNDAAEERSEDRPTDTFFGQRERRGCKITDPEVAGSFDAGFD